MISTFSQVTLESWRFSQVTLDFSTEERMQKTASLSYSPFFYSTVTLESTLMITLIVEFNEEIGFWQFTGTRC